MPLSTSRTSFLQASTQRSPLESRAILLPLSFIEPDDNFFLVIARFNCFSTLARAASNLKTGATLEVKSWNELRSNTEVDKESDIYGFMYLTPFREEK